MEPDFVNVDGVDAFTLFFENSGTPSFLCDSRLSQPKGNRALYGMLGTDGAPFWGFINSQSAEALKSCFTTFGDNPNQTFVELPIGWETPLKKIATTAQITCVSPKNALPQWFYVQIQPVWHEPDNWDLQCDSFIFDNMGEAFALHQLATNPDTSTEELLILEVNPAYEKMLGFSKTEVVGKGLLELLPKFNRQLYTTIVDVAKRGGRYHGRVAAPELGRYYQVALYSPKPDYVVALFADITQQKATDEALAESEKRYKMLADTTSDFISLNNAEGVFLYTSPAVTPMLGYGQDELVGKSVYELFHPDDVPAIRERHDQLLNEGSTPPLTFRLRHCHGDYIWIEASVHTQEGKGGEINIVAINRNVTEQVESREKLRLNEEKYRFLTENILDVIWVMDVQTLTFRYVSPSVQKLRGFTPEEVMAQRIEEALTPQSIEKIRAVLPNYINQFMQNGQSIEFVDEIEQIRKDGSTVWTEVVAYLKLNETNGRLEVIGTTRDMTDRKRAENARKELEDRYRTLTEVTNEGIMIHRNGVVVDVNPSMLRLLGTSLEASQLIGMKVYEFIHPEDIDLVKGKVANVVNGSYEVRVRRTDGSSFMADLFVRNTQINGVAHRVVSVTDITERKAAESKLVESELRFRRIFDNSIAGVLLCDNHGKIVLSNKSFEQLLDIDKNHLIGKKIFDFTLHEDVVVERLRINEAIKSGLDYLRFEKRMIHKSGKNVWVDMSLSFIRDVNGNLLSMVAIVNDITDKKNYELELLKALNYNKTINHTSPVGIVTTDQRGHVVFVNKKAQEIFDRKKTDFIGKQLLSGMCNALDLSGKELRRDQLPFNIVKHSRESVYDFRVLIELDNGTQKVLSINASPLFDEKASFFGVVKTLEDITDKVNLEKELRQSNNKLRELNSTKDKFFSIIAHDLRGPVGNIANLSELLNMSFAEQSSELNHQLIQTIYDNATKTFDLLANLLAWSYSQRNAISVNIQKMSAKQLVQESVEVIEGLANKKGIVFEKRLPDDFYVLADKDMAETVLRNLASNAVKYSYVDTVVDIGVMLSLKYPGFAEFYVVDYGIGIHANVLGRLFSTELDVSVAGTQGEEGTGLGLVLCREFVEKQNGHIWAESKPGKGSRFAFVLPLAEVGNV